MIAMAVTLKCSTAAHRDGNGSLSFGKFITTTIFLK